MPTENGQFIPSLFQPGATAAATNQIVLYTKCPPASSKVQIPRGGMAPLQHMQLPLRIPEADAKRVLASQLGYDVKLLLRPGHQRLAFLVRDELARVSSCVIQEVQVDKKGTVNLAAMAGSPATP